MSPVATRRHATVEEWPHDPWDDPDSTDAISIERPRRAHRSPKVLVYVFGALILVLILVAGAVGLWYVRELNPSGAPGAPVTFTVNASDTVDTLSVRLQREGLISNARLFRWYVDEHGGLDLTPGYYQLRPKDHMGNIMRILRTPPSQTYTKVTFPEGFSVAKMAARVSDLVPRLTATRFITAATNGVIRSKYEPEGYHSLEGLLFPDTYQVSNGETEGQVVVRMVSLMERVAGQENIDTKAPELGLTPYQVLVVASLIEREAKTDVDRAKIARVIYNRLALGMPLQIDATLGYGQDPNLTFEQLKALDSPYNTYLHTGLPPTPIANPGRASIRAALNPAPNPSLGDPLCLGLPKGTPCVYLYYVRIDADGNHAFAATLDQQNANIEKARAAGVL